MDRSENMSRIRGRDTSTEVKLRHEVWRLGLRYRLNKRVAGIKPDFIFPGIKLAVFVDGCFWHGCPDHYVRPRSSNAAFWASKLSLNVARDERQIQRLKAEGWRVIRVWEHEVKHSLNTAALFIEQVAKCGESNADERWAVIAASPGATADQEDWTLRELWTGKVRHVTRVRGADSR
jgi:DNA mismatch endonuclease (patch repair protein)